MKEGEIRKIKKKEIIEKLSDGIMTFDNAMSVIEQIQKSTKPTLMVEGRYDKLHRENFYALKRRTIPFELIDCGGADNMRHFAIVFNQLNIDKERVLFLCDYDEKGIKTYNDVKNQKYKVIYTLDTQSLSKNDDKKRLKNYPIEMLYPLETLKKHNLVEEIALSYYIDKLNKNLQIEKSLDFSKLPEKYKAFSKLQGKEKYKIKEDKKSIFANEVIKTLDLNNDFKELENLIERIEKSLQINS
ncbi:hypothetical protein [Helicobacter sp. MIT 14-3879]|uniref:hypothetical protein n=1 Tax=Helicobacter sp. MIT 14-3879 TaxID=2040649 RepID=UPI000E1F5D46|nr:hypothetical protein [Helicobacter sp. MIT 14-3879]RDU63544.1 hypothetical protein CQA44_05545 [Helicobacter sp. MIT 14-3879]